jgi:ABC-type transporter Mla subunit MlaD
MKGIKKMNKQRRKQLDAIIAKIQELSSDLECIMDEEQEYLESIPENLQSSERYEKAETACDSLQCALDSLEECVENIETAQE